MTPIPEVWHRELKKQKLAIAKSPIFRCALISVHGDPAVEVGREGAGGQNIYVRDLGLALAQLGCQVDMFTRKEDSDLPEIVEHAPGCRTIRLKAGPESFVHRDKLFDYLPKFVSSWLEFQQEHGTAYEILHSNYWLSGWVGLNLKSWQGIPQVHTYHSIGAVKYRVEEQIPEIASVRLPVERQILEMVNCAIATSPQEVEYLREFVSPRGRVRTIPCGIDTEHFSSIDRPRARQKLGISLNESVILYVGRFDRRKGIETLVRACAKLPQNFRLVLVGGSRDNERDGDEKRRIAALVKELGLESIVTFTGQISQAELPAYYAAASVCVIPSHYEPFGLVALEAMAAGTATIASRVGGLQYTIVPLTTGLLVPPRNVDALANALSQALTDPVKWELYGRAGAKWVRQRFSRLAIASQVLQLYQSVAYRNAAIVGNLIDKKN